MAKASATTYSIGEPSWLLLGFLIISVGVHAFLLGHIAGLYKSNAISYIELEMRVEEKPPRRSIPVPPQRKKIKPPLDMRSMKAMSPIPVEKPAAPPLAPEATVYSPSVVEPVASPQRPDYSNPNSLHGAR